MASAKAERMDMSGPSHHFLAQVLPPLAGLRRQSPWDSPSISEHLCCADHCFWVLTPFKGGNGAVARPCLLGAHKLRCRRKALHAATVVWFPPGRCPVPSGSPLRRPCQLMLPGRLHSGYCSAVPCIWNVLPPTGERPDLPKRPDSNVIPNMTPLCWSSSLPQAEGVTPILELLPHLYPPLCVVTVICWPSLCSPRH